MTTDAPLGGRPPVVWLLLRVVTTLLCAGGLVGPR